MGCQQSVPQDGSSAFGLNKTATTSDSRLKVELQQAGTTSSFKTKPLSVTGSPPGSTASLRTARTVASSSSGSFRVDDEPLYLLPKVDYNGHLLTEEIVRRTSSSIQSSALSIGTWPESFELQYAYRSQRGYDPQDPLKPNQEKYGITLNFASEGGGAMMGVFSGHGVHGQQCANFSQRVLPQQLAKFVRQKRVQKYKTILQSEGNAKKGAWNPKLWPLLSKGEYEGCCKLAFHETNKMMHEEAVLDDKFSGASIATVCFHGQRMFVSNVGDCSIILGRRTSGDCVQSSSNAFDGEEEKSEIEDYSSFSDSVEESRYVPRIAVPLTEDHTVHSQQEQERIIAAGGDVKQSDQSEVTSVYSGVLNDFDTKSLRVFLPGEIEPCTKFSRSIGDSGFEEVGIIPNPDVVSCDLNASDDILILASNGILEFLTHQEVVGICSASSDPLQASEAVTKAAYCKWIEHRNRCDDLTVIVCFLSNHEQTWASKSMESSSVDMHVMIDVAD
jgi:serine/threonine protein phosphatase PrpC